MTSAGDGEALDLTAPTVDSNSFTLERRSMVLLLQLARLALIVAALSRCGGPRDDLRADAAVARQGPKSGRRRPGAQRLPECSRR
jgi:hypothetical protein